MKMIELIDLVCYCLVISLIISWMDSDNGDNP